jgi:hypothetical protein
MRPLKVIGVDSAALNFRDFRRICQLVTRDRNAEKNMLVLPSRRRYEPDVKNDLTPFLSLVFKYSSRLYFFN